MPNFADHFNLPTGVVDGASMPSGTNGWLYKRRGGSSDPPTPWKYDKGHLIRGAALPSGGADTLLHRPGTQVVAGSDYDVRVTAGGFDYMEVMLRFSSTNLDRLGILVQSNVGKFVKRVGAAETETVLAQWERQTNTSFEIYVFVSANTFHIYDSGFPGDAHKAATVHTTELASQSGIGLSNGRPDSIVINDYSAGFVITDTTPAPVKTRVEADAHVIDDITAPSLSPHVEPYAGIDIETYTIVDGQPTTAAGRPPGITGGDVSDAGSWRVFARAPGQLTKDITVFRGVPTLVNSWDLADPGGAASATISLPAVTYFDEIGVGDLAWLSADTDIDIEWVGDLPAGYPDDRWEWPGFVSTFDYDEKGLTLTLLGAAYQADLYLAKPQYPQRPIPYEVAIANQFRDRPDLRLRPLEIEWPAWWTTVFDPEPKTPLYRLPTGVKRGDKWTGLVTRQTGSFDQSLTSYIQTLLGTMYTEQGRWTLELDPGRQPVLRHRDFKTSPDASTLVIDPATPGVKIKLSKDWTQSANAYFGQGVSLAGEAWSGQNVSPDGVTTTYEPLAAAAHVHPQTEDNTSLDLTKMRREVMLQLQEGLTLEQAKTAAAAQYDRFSEPGYTGTITLAVDPKLNGQLLPRKLIKQGMSLHLPGLFGYGVMLQITKVSVQRDSDVVSLTVDSKYRDARTVDEVMLRGRDSLAITRQLIGGQYAPPIPDQLVPWNYTEGAGYIPSGPEYSAVPLFEGADREVRFPWTEITTQRPPSDPTWAKCYMRIPAASTNADNNWAVRTDPDGLKLAFPVRAAQMATIRLIQVAAYDADGYVLPVPFHLSLYAADGVGVQAMPRMNAAEALAVPPYAAGQHYPFFENAWEKFREDGTQTQTEENQAVASAGLIRGFGTKFAPAGYWPNPAGVGVPTGLLVDEGQFEIDTTRMDSQFNPYQPRQVSPRTGYVYVMVYCDHQLGQDVYFMGRMFRAEPGATV